MTLYPNKKTEVMKNYANVQPEKKVIKQVY